MSPFNKCVSPWPSQICYASINGHRSHLWILLLWGLPFDIWAFRLSICLSVYISMYLYICLCMYLHMYLCMQYVCNYPSIYPSIYDKHTNKKYMVYYFYFFWDYNIYNSSSFLYLSPNPPIYPSWLAFKFMVSFH